MWSKVKALLRKAQARTHHDLLKAIAHALSCVTPHDALGWFAACGYNFIGDAVEERHLSVGGDDRTKRVVRRPEYPANPGPP